MSFQRLSMAPLRFGTDTCHSVLEFFNYVHSMNWVHTNEMTSAGNGHDIEKHSWNSLLLTLDTEVVHEHTWESCLDFCFVNELGIILLLFSWQLKITFWRCLTESTVCEKPRKPALTYIYVFKTLELMWDEPHLNCFWKPQWDWHLNFCICPICYLQYSPYAMVGTLFTQL